MRIQDPNYDVCGSTSLHVGILFLFSMDLTIQLARVFVDPLHCVCICILCSVAEPKFITGIFGSFLAPPFSLISAPAPAPALHYHLKNRKFVEPFFGSTT